MLHSPVSEIVHINQNQDPSRLYGAYFYFTALRTTFHAMGNVKGMLARRSTDSV